MARLYVGIDVHSRSHTVAILTQEQLAQGDEAWKRIPTFTIHNRIADYQDLLADLVKTGVPPTEIDIAIDHTGGFYSAPLVHFLTQNGYGHRLHFLQGKAQKDARERLLGEEDKDDDLDAAAMARALHLRSLSGERMRMSLQAPDLFSDSAILRAYTATRYKLTKMETMTVNRLHQYLAAVFPELQEKHFNSLLPHLATLPPPNQLSTAQRPPHFRKATWDDILKKAPQTVGIKSPAYHELLVTTAQLRDILNALTDQLETKIKTLAQTHQYYPILSSFPGINSIAAATLIGIIGDITRWKTKAAFRKAMGMYGKSTGSANKTTASMGREGSPVARRVLFMVVMNTINPNTPDNPIRDYYNHLRKRDKDAIPAMVASARKLSDLLYTCLKTMQPYHYQKPVKGV